MSGPLRMNIRVLEKIGLIPGKTNGRFHVWAFDNKVKKSRWLKTRCGLLRWGDPKELNAPLDDNSPLICIRCKQQVDKHP